MKEQNRKVHCQNCNQHCGSAGKYLVQVSTNQGIRVGYHQGNGAGSQEKSQFGVPPECQGTVNEIDKYPDPDGRQEKTEGNITCLTEKIMGS